MSKGKNVLWRANGFRGQSLKLLLTEQGLVFERKMKKTSHYWHVNDHFIFKLSQELNNFIENPLKEKLATLWLNDQAININIEVVFGKFPVYVLHISIGNMNQTYWSSYLVTKRSIYTLLSKLASPV